MTTTDFFEDGTVVQKREIADNNLESMPNITELMRSALPAPKKEEEIKLGGFVDPNQIRSEEEVRRNGGKYFETQLKGMRVAEDRNPRALPLPQIVTYVPEPLVKPTRAL